MENQLPERPIRGARSKKDGVSQRVCLSCSKEFKSKHKFNRICTQCTETNKTISPKHYSINE